MRERAKRLDRRRLRIRLGLENPSTGTSPSEAGPSRDRGQVLTTQRSEHPLRRSPSPRPTRVADSSRAEASSYGRSDDRVFSLLDQQRTTAWRDGVVRGASPNTHPSIPSVYEHSPSPPSGRRDTSIHNYRRERSQSFTGNLEARTSATSLPQSIMEQVGFSTMTLRHPHNGSQNGSSSRQSSSQAHIGSRLSNPVEDASAEQRRHSARAPTLLTASQSRESSYIPRWGISAPPLARPPESPRQDLARAPPLRGRSGIQGSSVVGQSQAVGNRPGMSGRRSRTLESVSRGILVDTASSSPAPRSQSLPLWNQEQLSPGRGIWAILLNGGDRRDTSSGILQFWVPW